MNILTKFPKERIELPEAYQKIYEQHYLSNREGKYKTTSLSQKLESWMHKKVAADIKGSADPRSTLEIGAGTLNQLQFEERVGNYDIVEPFRELYEGSPLLSRVDQIYADISEIPFDKKYDRITTVATFEHIMDLPFVVAHAAKHLQEGGSLRVAIPNEGTIMWRIGTMITGAEFKKKYGLDYQVLMRYEHVNTAADIEGVLKYFFHHAKCSVFGLSKGLAFYRFYECSEVRQDRIDAFFNER
ncbi:MAG: methyltransferase domain-containing protein [Flavobacteriia bacterium]